MATTIEKFLKDKDMGYLLYRGLDFDYKDRVMVLDYKNFL